MLPDPTDPPELYLQLANPSDSQEGKANTHLPELLEAMTLFADTLMTVSNADSPVSLGETLGKRVWQHELMH